MDSDRCEEVTRLFTTLPSRREVLRGPIAAGRGFGALRLPEAAAANA